MKLANNNLNNDVFKIPITEQLSSLPDVRQNKYIFLKNKNPE